MSMGIDGILYSGPIADLLAAGITVLMVIYEFKVMKKLETSSNQICS